jgi:manganese oxidase
MSIRAAGLLIASAFFWSLSGSAGAPAPLQERPTAVPNDNRISAGRAQGDSLVLNLSVVPSRWFLLGDQNPAFNVVAFAEEGRAPTIPGPMIRVTAGTMIHATIRNPLADTLVLRGLGERGLVQDTIVILPRSSVEIRFPANRVGAHFYWATASSSRRMLAPQLQTGPGLVRLPYDSQLTGAFIVDPPGARPDERVFVITTLADQARCGRPCRERHGVPAREFNAINGRSWPNTERLQYTVGDSVRWRLINAAIEPHPMHLHGFYFRVDAEGSMVTGRDTVYAPEQRRMVVTESLSTGESASIVWSPDRPGGWIFHCHLTNHVAKLPPVDEPDSLDWPDTHDHVDPDQHVLEGMNGLVLGINVTGPPSVRDAREARRLRLFIQSDSVPGTARRFGYVLQRGAEPRRDSVEYPGPVLVLTRGEPTVIDVINRAPEASSVHWHGIELESYYDGAVGWSGTPGNTAPAIRPGTTFEVRMTAPRAGTFMYHTHFDELRQQFGGLVGALIVLEPGERWDATRDLMFLLSDGTLNRIFINGSLTPPDVDLTVGTTYRIRIADISVYRPNSTVRVVRGASPETWRALAKDGFALPEAQARTGPSIVAISSGETADFSFTPTSPGDLALEYRVGPTVQGSVRLRVSAAARASGS